MADAKTYLAMKKVVKHYKVDGIAVDCWALYSSKLIKAWPRLSFMELSKEKAVCGCGVDLTSEALVILVKHLAELPGFVTNPSIDEERSEVTAITTSPR